MGPRGYFPGEIPPREEGGGIARRDLEPWDRFTESLSVRRVGGDPTLNCVVAVLGSKLEGPGRRIGQRGDATRAPTQGPRPGWAAGRRPSASRDWPESDKSIDSSCSHRLAGLARSFSPFLLYQPAMPYACSNMVANRELLPTVNPEEPELLTHLAPSVRAGTISTWCDRQITPGLRWFDEIRAALGRASVCVMLVTPKFLASDFIHEHELQPLLKESESAGVTILWVLIRECSWQETLISEFQAVVSPPDKAFALMKAERDTAWTKVCMAIKDAVSSRLTPNP